MNSPFTVISWTILFMGICCEKKKM